MTYNTIIDKFKKVDNKELENYIICESMKYYDYKCSTNIEDYVSDFKDECVDIVYNTDGSILEVFEGHIEFTKVGKEPLIVNWYKIYAYENYNAMEYCNYNYVENYI